MALVGTLLLTLALGGGEYGLLMSSKHDLNVATRLAGRVGSTPCADTGSGTSTGGCNKGNTDYDDFAMLRAIESGLGGRMSDVEKVVVYGTSGRTSSNAPFTLYSGRPPAICLAAVSGVTDSCNVYTKDTLVAGTSMKLFQNLDYFYQADGGFDRTKLDLTFNCNSGSSSPTKPYCPTGNDVNGIPLRLRSLSGATSMGVYIKMKHSFVTGFIRDSQKISDWTMFRLEPHPLVNETLRQCDPSVDPACVAAPTSVQIRVTDASVTESATPGNCANIRISINVALDSAQTVVLSTSNDTADAGTDYTATSQTVTFPAGITSQDICIPILNDNFYETQEKFSVALSNGSAGLKDSSGNLSGKTTGTVTIDDDDVQPTLSVNDISINEGSTGSFTVTMSAAMGIPATFNWSTTNGTAVAPGDYNSVPSSGVTFAPGETTKTIQVVTNTDNISEASENFSVNLVVVSGAQTTGGKLSGTGTIVDQTAPPVISIGDPPAAVNEGTSLVFPVTLDHPVSTAMTVRYSTVNGTATGGSDFTTRTNVTLNIPANTTSLSISISTTNDSIDELSPENFTVVLNTPSSPLTIGNGTATGLINDNDSPPTVSMSPTPTVNVTEGNTQTFTVTLSRASFQNVVVNYSSANGTATAGTDYTGASSSLTFAPGVTSMTFTIATTNDAVIEPNETFTVTATGAAGSAGNTVNTTVTIVDNDTPTTTTTTTTTRPTTTTSTTTTTTRPTTSTTTTRPATTTTQPTTSTTTTRPASTTSTTTTTTRPTTTTSTTTTTRPTTTTTSTTTTRPTTTTTTTTRPTTTTTRPATTTTVVIIDPNT